MVKIDCIRIVCVYKCVNSKFPPCTSIELVRHTTVCALYKLSISPSSKFSQNLYFHPSSFRCSFVFFVYVLFLISAVLCLWCSLNLQKDFFEFYVSSSNTYSIRSVTDQSVFWQLWSCKHQVFLFPFFVFFLNHLERTTSLISLYTHFRCRCIGFSLTLIHKNPKIHIKLCDEFRRVFS